MTDDLLSNPLVYPLSPAQTDLRSDLVYKSSDGRDLRMDIYSPRGLSDNERLPAVFFIHGGPIDEDMSPKDWGIFKSYGQLMAGQNFTGVTFNHRLFSLKELSTSLEDINDAISFIEANASQFHIDASRICVWGFSGGGPLLGSVVEAHQEHIRCWLAFYAHIDLTNVAHQLEGLLTDEEIRKFTSSRVLELDQAGDIPMLIAQAGQDRPVLNKAISRFIQEALEHNRPMTLVNHPTGQHGFDFLDDDQRSREIIAMAIAFVRQHLD